MNGDLELQIRKIEEKEYLVVPCENGNTYYIQDFIQYPRLVPPSYCKSNSVKFSGVSIREIISNAEIGDVSGISGETYPCAIISGKFDFFKFFDERCPNVGIHEDCLSDFATHSLICDSNGFILPEMRKRKLLPIGLFSMMTSNKVIQEWSRKSSCGIFGYPYSRYEFIGHVSKSIDTEIFAEDLASGAIHLLNTLYKTWNFILIGADLTVDKKHDGFLDLGCGRFIHPENEWTLRYLEAVCHIIMRNGGNIFIINDTMNPINGAKLIDSKDIGRVIEESL